MGLQLKDASKRAGGALTVLDEACVSVGIIYVEVLLR